MSHRRLFSVLVVVLLSAVGAPPILAALDIYLHLEGADQGTIEGEVSVPGFENQIVVYDFHHLVLRPPSSSTTTHKEIIFTKTMGKASPPMWTALDKAEVMVEARFTFRRPGPVGQDVHYYSIVLQNARITAIEPITASVLDPDTVSLPSRERVRMAYQHIALTYEIDGITAELENEGP